MTYLLFAFAVSFISGGILLVALIRSAQISRTEEKQRAPMNRIPYGNGAIFGTPPILQYER